jgi:hypothetical protein
LGLFGAKQFTEEASTLLRLWVVLVALAALALWHSGQCLVDVLTASGPGGFTALAAGYLLTHFGILRLFTETAPVDFDTP